MSKTLETQAKEQWEDTANQVIQNEYVKEIKQDKQQKQSLLLERGKKAREAKSVYSNSSPSSRFKSKMTVREE